MRNGTNGRHLPPTSAASPLRTPDGAALVGDIRHTPNCDVSTKMRCLLVPLPTVKVTTEKETLRDRSGLRETKYEEGSEAGPGP